MTVGAFPGTPTAIYGYFIQSGTRYGTLDDTDIEYGGETRTVSKLQFADGALFDQYNINLNAFVPRGTEFDIGGNVVKASNRSETATIGQYAWDATNPPGWLDGQKVTVSANFPPALVSATVDGASLVLAYHEDLDTGSTPAASAYAVGGAPRVGVGRERGKTVTLTLATAAASGQTVTVSYTVPASNPVQDASGLKAPAFASTDHTVTNNTGTTTNTAPEVDTEIENQVATAGTPFSFTFLTPPSATVDTGDMLTYTATKGNDDALPSWLDFTPSTRTFSGTPTASDVGTLTVKVTASDGTDSVDDEFDIVVRAALVATLTETPGDNPDTPLRRFELTLSEEVKPITEHDMRYHVFNVRNGNILSATQLSGTHPVSTAGREAGPADPGRAKTCREVRAGLRGQGRVPGGVPVPGQQLVHPGVWQLGDAGKHIGEPSLRVDVVELGGGDEGVHRRGALAAAVGAGEQP